MGRGGRLRRWALRLLIAGILLVVLAAAGVLALLSTERGERFVLQKALAAARPSVPGLSVGTLEIDPLGRITLRDVALDDVRGGPVLRLRRLSVSYEPSALLRGTLRVGSIELEEPRVTLRRLEDGRLNVEAIAVPSPAPEPEEPAEPFEPPDWGVELGSLTIEGGDVDADVTPEGPVHVAGLRLDVEAATRGRSGRAAVHALQADITLPDGRVLGPTLSATASLDDDEVSATLKGTVTGAAVGGPVGLDVSVSGQLAAARLDVGVHLPSDGLVRLEGRAGLPDGRPEADLALTVARLDPSSLLEGLIAGDLNVEVRLQASGVPLQEGARAEVRVVAGPSRAADVSVDRVALQASLDGAAWTLHTLEAAAAGATLRASGAGTLKALEADVDVDAPDLSRLASLVPGVDLGGLVKLKAHVAGPFEGPLSVEAHAVAEGVTAPGVRVEHAEIDATAKDIPARPHGTATVRARGVRPDDPRLALDEVDLTARGDAGDVTVRLRSRGPQLRAAVDGRARIEDGDVDVSLRTLDAAAMGWAVRLLAPTSARRTATGDVDLEEMRVAVLGGEATVSGTWRPKGDPRATVRLRLDDAHVPKGPRVTGDVGAVLGAERLDAEVTLTATPGGEIGLTAAVPVRYGEGPAPALAMEAPLQASVRLSGADIEALRSLVAGLPDAAGVLGAEVEVGGSVVAPTARAHVTLDSARVGPLGDLAADVRLTTGGGATAIEVHALRQGQPAADVVARVDTDLSGVATGRRLTPGSLGRVPVSATVRVPATDLRSLAPMVPALARAEGAVALSVALAGRVLEPKAEVAAQWRGATLDGRALGDLEARLTADSGPRSSSGAAEVTDAGRPLLRATWRTGITARGVARGRPIGHAPVEAELRIPGYDLSRLPRLDETQPDVKGDLVATVRVSGALPMPEVEADLSASGVVVDDVAAGSLTASARVVDREATARVTLSQAGGGELELDARAPVDGSRFDATVRAFGIDLAPLHQVVPAIAESAGRLDMELTAGGTPAAPVVAGRVRLGGGRLRVEGVSPVEDMNLVVDIQPERATVETLRLSLGGGSLDGNGWVDLAHLQPGAFHVALRADELRFDAGTIRDAMVSGEIGVDGALAGDQLHAKVVIEKGVMLVPKMKSTRDLQEVGPLEDVVYVDAAAAEQAAGEQGEGEVVAATRALRIDVTAQADPFFVRGDDADVEAWLDVRARSDDEGRIRLTGGAGLRRGRLEVLGNPLEVQRATVQFSGEPVPDPAIDVQLTRRFPDAQAIIALDGTAKSPRLDLRSDPPIYDRSQVMSLLLTGSADTGQADETGGTGDGGGGSAAVATAVSQVLVGGLAREIAPKVGLDVARVRLAQDEETGDVRAQAELGKYLTERLYLAYRPVIGAEEEENANEAVLEYRLSALWLLSAWFGDRNVGGLDVAWTWRY